MRNSVWITVVTMAAAFMLPFTTVNRSYAEQCCAFRSPSIELNVEVIADGLDHPWGMAFLPDGSVLVTERSGNLRRIVGGNVSRPFRGLPRIAARGQGGLLDIALDPEFSENQQIYFSYSKRSNLGQRLSTAVARARLDLASRSLRNVKVIFEANNKSTGGRHFGSRIRFAPDKTLFITIGDRGTQPRAQDPFDHAGSVIRINRDGSVPADNPYADGREALPEIWSTGHRNPQGAAIHPDTGQLWTLSHGAAGGDEINIPEAGKNYGWPLISYGTNYSGAGFEKGASAAGLEQPIYYWDPSIAPSGLAFYQHSDPLIPGWNGSLLVGALKSRHLSRLIVEGDKIVGEEWYLEGQVGRVRDVRNGPDGAVWLLTDDDNGLLVRLTQK